MAYKLRFDGTNDNVNIPTWTAPAASNYTINVKFETVASITSGGILFGSSSNYLYIFADGILRFRYAGSIQDNSPSGTIKPNQSYEVIITRTSGTNIVIQVIESGVSIYNSSVSNAGQTDLALAFNVIGEYAGNLRGDLLEMTLQHSGGGNRFYDPSVSNGTGLVLTDTTGAQNGTLVDFPADNSQWIQYGGGGGTDALLADDISSNSQVSSPTLSAFNPINAPINLSAINVQATSVRLIWARG